jgi:glycosyltransferase involved in cell wall biosynthesis
VKVLFVATVVQKHIMEFHVPYLKMFKERGWETAVAARNDYDNPADCHIPYCDHYYDIPFERSPFKSGNITAYKELKQVIDNGHYDIIHCHTPVGAALTRLAAEDARKKGTKVFYTAHGFHFYDGAPLVNWLTYYPVEKWLATKTDVLITINKEDYHRAKKNFKAGKVVYVPGVGIDLSRFESKPYIREQKRKELGFKKDDLLLLSVGELIERKNHRVVLEAIGKLKKEKFYKNLHYIICGTGVLMDELKELCKELDISDHVHFLGYRNDISDICNASDIFLFMSHQEGLPVALMEAMACGLPAICSKVRGNTDLIEDGKNGLFAENNAGDVSQKMEELATSPEKRQAYGLAAEKTIKKYDLTSVESKMIKIYKSSENSGGGTKD